MRCSEDYANNRSVDRMSRRKGNDMNIIRKIKNFFGPKAQGNLVEIDSLEAYFQNAGISSPAAQSCATVYACVRVLADSIASLPCKLMVKDGETIREDAANNLFWLLNQEPMPGITSATYWRFNIKSLLTAGFFLSLAIRAGNGKITRLIPVHPSRVSQIELLPSGGFSFTVINREGAILHKTSKDVLFVPYDLAGPDFTRPVGPLDYLINELKTLNSSQKFLYKLLERNARPNGYWTKTNGTISSDEVYRRLKEQLSEIILGNGATRTPLVEDGLEFRETTQSNTDLQLLELMRFTTEQVAGVFGVPLHMIGDIRQAKGWSTNEQQEREFVTTSLIPITNRIEKAIVSAFIPDTHWGRQFPKFNYKGRLRGDINTQANFYQKMNQIGVMSINEIRVLEDMNPIAGGDVHLVPMNYQELNKGESEK